MEVMNNHITSKLMLKKKEISDGGGPISRETPKISCIYLLDFIVDLASLVAALVPKEEREELF